MENNKGEIIIYRSKNGKTMLDVKLANETVWLTLNQIAELFNKTVPNISMHIKNIFSEKELDRSSTVKKSLTVQTEGGRTISRNIDYYNLDIILSVGYRVKSKEGTQFRIWATGILRDHLINGFTVNFKRLKELEYKFEFYKDSFESFKFTVNKFLINSARRDVVNAVIDDMDKLKGEFKTFISSIDKAGKQPSEQEMKNMQKMMQKMQGNNAKENK